MNLQPQPFPGGYKSFGSDEVTVGDRRRPASMELPNIDIPFISVVYSSIQVIEHFLGTYKLPELAQETLNNYKLIMGMNLAGIIFRVDETWPFRKIGEGFKYAFMVTEEWYAWNVLNLPTTTEELKIPQLRDYYDKFFEQMNTLHVYDVAPKEGEEMTDKKMKELQDQRLANIKKHFNELLTYIAMHNQNPVFDFLATMFNDHPHLISLLAFKMRTINYQKLAQLIKMEYVRENMLTFMQIMYCDHPSIGNQIDFTLFTYQVVDSILETLKFPNPAFSIHINAPVYPFITHEVTVDLDQVRSGREGAILWNIPIMFGPKVIMNILFYSIREVFNIDFSKVRENALTGIVKLCRYIVHALWVSRDDDIQVQQVLGIEHMVFVNDFRRLNTMEFFAFAWRVIDAALMVSPTFMQQIKEPDLDDDRPILPYQPSIIALAPFSYTICNMLGQSMKVGKLSRAIISNLETVRWAVQLFTGEFDFYIINEEHKDQTILLESMQRAHYVTDTKSKIISDDGSIKLKLFYKDFEDLMTLFRDNKFILDKENPSPEWIFFVQRNSPDDIVIGNLISLYDMIRSFLQYARPVRAREPGKGPAEPGH